mmetsp:Transcript_3503/g.2520  ORF Transcript_3503/g.2520 Transcript_3503/m.2520 type:complete len:225 (+) Transcript_3503:197-871(+)
MGEAQPEWICPVLAKALKNLNVEYPQTLYSLAEVQRLLKCKQLTTISEQIKSALKDTSALEDVNDIYYLFLLFKGAKFYDAEKPDSFKDFIKAKAKDLWEKDFKEDWSFNKETKDAGLTLESLRVAQMISSVKSDSSTLGAAVSKVLEQAFEDGDTWFIVTKNAPEFDNSEINLELLKVLLALKTNPLQPQTLIKFRNYFYQKALGARTLTDLASALKALQKLN